MPNVHEIKHIGKYVYEVKAVEYKGRLLKVVPVQMVPTTLGQHQDTYEQHEKRMKYWRVDATPYKFFHESGYYVTEVWRMRKNPKWGYFNSYSLSVSKDKWVGEKTGTWYKFPLSWCQEWQNNREAWIYEHS